MESREKKKSWWQVTKSNNIDSGVVTSSTVLVIKWYCVRDLKFAQRQTLNVVNIRDSWKYTLLCSIVIVFKQSYNAPKSRCIALTYKLLWLLNVSQYWKQKVQTKYLLSCLCLFSSMTSQFKKVNTCNSIFNM